MSKIKMRCNTCGKWFQSANAKEVTCPDCVQKARKEKLAAKNAPPPETKNTPTAQARTVAQAPKPKHVQSGTNQWLDSLSDVKVAEPEPPKPKIIPPLPPREQQPPGNRQSHPAPSTEQHEDSYPRREGPQRGGIAPYDDERRPSGNYRPNTPSQGPNNYRPSGPGNYRPGGPAQGGYRPSSPESSGSPSSFKPRQPMDGRNPRGPKSGPGHEHGPSYKPKPRPKNHASKPAAPPKPKREKIPPPEPFTPTEEQIKLVEQRYAELATPAEFDGIRTQIAQELGIPKKAVKTIIKDFRDQQHIPSWWEVQTYKGSNEDLEKIKTTYLPYLPIPHVGIHKKIAEDLDMKPGIVYQAIKSIRLEMNLPQYNDPSFHEEELAAIRQQHTQKKKASESPSSETIPEAAPEDTSKDTSEADPSKETSSEAASNAKQEVSSNATQEDTPPVEIPTETAEMPTTEQSTQKEVVD